MSAVDKPTYAASTPPQPPSLSARFFRPRTLVSFLVGAVILVVVLSRLQVNVGDTLRVIATANWPLVLLALAVYYLVFPIRAVRWRIMLENAGFRRDELPSLANLVEIIYLSCFANSVVPAKLGDIYRAYLLRERSASRVSFSKAGGTIVAERLLDLAVLLVLFGVTGLLSFQGAVPGPVLTVIEIGSVIVLAVGIGVLFLRQITGQIRRLVPARFDRMYDNFVAGAVNSFGRYPQLLGLSLLAWLAEAGRLFLVTQAFGVHLSPNPLIEATRIVFIALGAAFLTAPPGTPAGFGYVEASVVVALTMMGLNQSVALSIALLDRAISVESLWVGGLIVYLLGARRAPLQRER